MPRFTWRFGRAGFVLMHLERRDPKANAFRRYTVELTRSLFGHWGVERAWGPIGKPGRSKVDWFEDRAAAGTHYWRLVNRKQRRGYRITDERFQLPARAELGQGAD